MTEIKPKRAAKIAVALAQSNPPASVAELRELMLAARRSIPTSANATLTTLYWQIGHRIRRDILQEKRAEYGERIVSALGTQLADLNAAK